MKKIDRPENHGKEWTLQDMKNLLKLWASPRTAESIARELGRSEPAVRIRIRIVRIAVEMAKDFIKKPKDLERVVKGLVNAPGRAIKLKNVKVKNG